MGFDLAPEPSEVKKLVDAGVTVIPERPRGWSFTPYLKTIFGAFTKTERDFGNLVKTREFEGQYPDFVVSDVLLIFNPSFGADWIINEGIPGVFWGGSLISIPDIGKDVIFHKKEIEFLGDYTQHQRGRVRLMYNHFLPL